ncbi:hypothetical protein FMM75_21205 [Lachnospiraceae bacterium MD335]|nr:hypothetical protein [Lachnospiraceae bacterium MD335]
MEKKSIVITSLMIIYVAFFSIGCNVSESQSNKVTQSESLEIQQSLVQENENVGIFLPVESAEDQNAEQMPTSEFVEREAVELTLAEDREIDLTDYSAYLRKIWIVDGWEEEERRKDYPVSFVITKLESGKIAGYLAIGYSVTDYYFKLSRWGDSIVHFQGRIYDGTAECKYIDTSQNRQEAFRFMFCGNDRIQAELGDDEEQQYLLRPYNIFTDVDLCGEPTLFEVDLDSWGTVLIAYANTESNHSIPYVALINNQGDILYEFLGTYRTYVTSFSVYDVIVADMNGDGRKDVKVNIYYDYLENDDIGAEAYFYQIENGMFYLGLENEFLHDEPHSYYYSREGDLVLEKVLEFE